MPNNNRQNHSSKANPYHPVCKDRCCKKGDVWIANMGHGETIVFQKNGEYFLRDFGESSENRAIGCSVGKILADSAPSVKMQCSDDKSVCPLKSACVFRMLPHNGHVENGPKWNAILSHAHSDHFNGFMKLFESQKTGQGGRQRNIFEEVYLPCFCSKQEDFEKYSKYVEAALISYCFFDNFNSTDAKAQLDKQAYAGKEEASVFLTYEIVMSGLSSQVTHLSAAHSSPEQGFAQDIYLPIRDAINDAAFLNSGIEPYVERFWQALSDSNLDLDGNDSVEAIFVGPRNEISSILQHYLLLDSGNNSRNKRTDYDNVMNMVSVLATRTSQIRGRFDQQKLTDAYLTLVNVLSRNIDDASLVFDVTFECEAECTSECCNDNNGKIGTPCRECDDPTKCNSPSCPLALLASSSETRQFPVNWLFLGDNHDSIIRTLFANGPFLRQNYDFIKAAHHGSRGGQALKAIGEKSNCVVCCCGNGHRSNAVQIEYAEISKCVVLTALKDRWKQKGQIPPVLEQFRDKIKVLPGNAW